MTLTKKQMIYGSVLLLAAGGFAWDRVNSGPAVSVGAPVAPAAAVARSPVKAQSLVPQVPSAPARMGVSENLRQAASAQHLDAGASENAFALPAVWQPAPVKPPEAIGVAKASDEEILAEAFVKKHKLDAVIVRGGRGYAMIDGKTILIGQSIDKFQLLSVSKTTAIFSRGERRIELRLAADSKLVRQGAAIENKPADGDETVSDSAGK